MYNENCPTCGEPGIKRDRSPNGNTYCKNNHSWKSGTGITKEEEKPNCYECIYRRTIPGDAHSSCNYPGLDSSISSLIFNMQTNLRIGKELNIKAVEHGIKSGWFLWPCNFDPIWLISCKGFTKKE